MRNYLIVGENGAADALGRALAQAPGVDRVDCAGMNVGLARLGRCWDIDSNDFGAVADLALRVRADVVLPLSSVHLGLGICDALRAKRIICFGPGRAAAALEVSKYFAKGVVSEAGIATPRCEWHRDPASAARALPRFGLPVVIKSSGHAKPQGVQVCSDREQAREALATVTGFRNAGMDDDGILIEEYVAGEEVSLIGVLEGSTFRLLGIARDHKRLLDGDAGPNTAGMGAFSPVPEIEEQAAELVSAFVMPLARALARRGIDYVGFLYLGLIRSPSGWQLLEVNVRPGDPETQVILPRLATDLDEIIWRAVNRSLAAVEVTARARSYVSVACATIDYPFGNSAEPVELSGVQEVEQRDLGCDVFYAKCRRQGDRLYSTYGRVAHIVAGGESVAEARGRVYAALREINTAGIRFRTDIGAPKP